MFIFGGIMDVTKEKNDIFAFSMVLFKHYYNIYLNFKLKINNYNKGDYSWTKVHTNTNTIYSKSPGKRKVAKEE